ATGPARRAPPAMPPRPSTDPLDPEDARRRLDPPPRRVFGGGERPMTTPARRGKGPSRPLRRAVEVLLWALAAVLLGWCVLAYVEARLYQAREDRIIDEATRAQPAPEPAEVEEPTEEAAPVEASVPKTSP